MFVANDYSHEQRVVSQKVVITDGSLRLYPVQIRYAGPRS